MDRKCVTALGRSDITIRHFEVPRGAALGVFLAVVGGLAGWSSRSFFEEGGLWSFVLSEGWRERCFAIQPWFFWGIVVVHLLEVAFVMPGKLKRHNVNPASGAYWLWLGDTFLQGIGSMKR